jgi:hypothetical protein
MNEQPLKQNYSPAELIQAKFLELKDFSSGKYFFLYFLHLMGYLTYEEANGESVFSDNKNTFKVPLPMIDSEAQYRELEKVHLSLENFFEFLKNQEPSAESFELKLLENF